MSTPNNDKYVQLHHALIQSPDYMGIPSKNRQACVRFVSIAAKLNCKTKPNLAELEAAFAPAVEEACNLVAQGLLTVDLHEDESVPPSVGNDGGSVPQSQEPKDEGLAQAKNTQDEDGSQAVEPQGNQESAPTDNAPPEKYGVHPAAKIFPMMEPDALNELAQDIKTNGLQQPVVIHDGMVIDGRNRLEACKQGGIEPTYIEWTGKGSVVTWVLSVNLHRRHLTDQQRAMIAARVAEQFSAEAKERSAQNLRKNKDVVDESNQSTPGLGRLTERAAAVMNVSPSAAKKAAKVLKSGDEQLTKAVDTGKVSIDAAAQVASLPKSKQRKLVEAGKVQEAAKKIRKSKADVKAKSDKATGSDGAPDPVPVTTREVVPAAAAPKPLAKPVAEPKPVEVDESPAELLADSEALVLLKDAHDVLNDMVATGIAAGQARKIENFLRNLVIYIEEYKAKLG